MHKTRSRLFSLLLNLALILALLLPAAPGVTPARAAPTDLFFSEYIEGSSNNKALEIYNGTGAAIDLAAGDYSIFMSFNGGTSTLTIDLTGTVAAGDVYVVAHASAVAEILAQADQTSTAGWFNGDDAVVLYKGPDIIDVIGQIGYDPGSEWGTGLVSTADNTLRRKSGIEAGDPNAADTFDPSVEWDGYAQNTFDGLGTHGTPVNQPVVASCGSALSTEAGTAVSTTVSATDADGVVTNIVITSVTPAPAAGTITWSDLVPATEAGGTATATVNVDSSVPAGAYSVLLTATNDDAIPQTGTCTLSVTVIQVLPIGAIQGAVADTQDGKTFESAYVGQTVAIQGVIYEKVMARTSAGVTQYGFFIQNTAATADGDPNSSDGIYVFMSKYTTLIGGYAPVVGDEVVLSGKVSEYYYLTELSSASLVRLARSGVDLEAEVPAFEVNPPDVLADANRYWERHEGMRALVPANSLVLDGRDVFAGTADAEIWLARGDSQIAQRHFPFIRRAFRDAHPLDNKLPRFDDGNGYRIILGSLGVKAAAGDNTVLLSPARTFDTVTNALVGGLYFSFSKYQIQVEQQPELASVVDPAQNFPPQPFNRKHEFSIATYNVENLYDYRDDPFDGCDFTGNEGCEGVDPPFDYVPASEAAYQAHLNELALQIIEDLHGPDILLVQEAEDQDICTVTGGALACGEVDNADGQPDTLQELALTIQALSGREYAAAYDRDGGDDRGIVAAFLYRTDLVELLTPASSDPVLGSSPLVDYRGAALAYNTDVQNPKALNAVLPEDVDASTGLDGDNVFTRDPQVGLFRIWKNRIGSGHSTTLYAVSNHFSSTPAARVGQRTEQAAYNAAIVAALQQKNRGVKVAVGGDLNVYPRPDDPFVPGDELFPSDQLGPLYDQRLVNMFTVLVATVPSSAYSYVYEGQAQTLDQLFITPSLFLSLVQARTAHINADWPAEYDGDGARGASDHDPLVVRFRR